MVEETQKAIPESAPAPKEKPAPAAPVEVLLVAQHKHGALVRAGDSFKILPPKAYNHYKPEEKEALPFRFEMASTDWGNLLKPESFGQPLGLSGEYAKQVDIALWRHGFWLKGDKISDAAKRAALAGLQRAGSEAFAALQS